MQKRSNAIVVGGVFVALLGMLLVFVYARGGAAGTTLGGGTPAFVTTTDIPVGTRWEDMRNLVEQRSVSERERPASAVISPTQLNGRTASQSIRRGQVITTNQFTSPSGGLDIPPGQNAITINLSVPAGVARYVQAGSLTNIYATFKGVPGINSAADSVVTKLILSNVKVLANRIAGPVEEQQSSNVANPTGDVLLTLALTPQDAEKLIFAKENGNLWFGLVNPDNPPVTTTGRTFRSALI
ncbi:MAG: Flp pilus assembly protein CpaB [Actinomycetota bacterium]|nr:Flp pilus assembly protein CpaB [Actinomycetota bacterium]